ncbi:MAG: VCBS repeat-containing protein [Planctomycetia bacterium]|nr:VCBS repeat-containing protein [Planctomycetia bacterium]
MTWTPADAASPVDLEISTDGATWSLLAAGLTNDGMEIVTAPGTPSTTARVRVTETASGASDISDADFVLSGIRVLFPNGGETWATGGPATVTWVGAGFAGTVDIEISTDGTTWSPLATATPNDGTQTVTAPAILATTARVRVSETTGALSDVSDADFSIAAPWVDVGAGLMGIWQGAIEWGDYDNDGDLDLAAAGYVDWVAMPARIYRNDGGGVFTDIGATLPAVYSCGVAWGDYDRDGDLDLALVGNTSGSTAIARVFRNDGAGVFKDIAAGMIGTAWVRDVAWGDYDNDGDLDLAYTGYVYGDTAHFRLYRNDGGDKFTDIAPALPNLYQTAIAWGDYDNDGDLDLALAGYSISLGNITRVYRNDGDGVFTDIGAGLTGVAWADIAWGDYDNDGDLDLCVAGETTTARVSRIYRNDGSGVFVDIAAPIVDVRYAAVAWGDHDNDGDLDLAISGGIGSLGNATRVYRNDGGIFSDIGAPLTDVRNSNLAWGDFDGDGDLDLAVAGWQTSTTPQILRIFRNNQGVLNAEPGAPGGLTAIPAAGAVGLSWGAAVDDHTPAAGLDYNLRIGTSPGGQDVCAPMADTGTGARQLPWMGLIRGGGIDASLPPGTYYWSVQAIDPGLAGGAWALEASFVVPAPPPVLTVLSPNGGETWTIGVPAIVTWLPVDTGSPVNIELTLDGTTWFMIAAGVVNDGSHVISPPATPSMTARVRVTETSSGTIDASDADFNIGESWQDIVAGISEVKLSGLAWGDYDGDGDLDLVMGGLLGSGDATTRIYRNDGIDVFVDILAGLPDLWQCSFAWGDYDRDGDLDLAMIGGIPTAGGVYFSRIYRNDGADKFTDIGAPLTPVKSGSLAWGDFDQDGDLDLLLAGSAVGGAVANIYRNDGGGIFTDIVAGLTGVFQCSAAWGDHDLDGDLDLALAGYDDAASVPISRIYRNDSGGVFTDIGASLTGCYVCSLAWGDYDNDGDLDLALLGGTGPSRFTRIYRNDGASGFTDIVAGLIGLGYGFLAWGDSDNDGDLDLAMMGDSAFTVTSRIYRNGGGIFANTGATITQMFQGGLCWGDYDNDGDLDLAMNGQTVSGQSSPIYRNVTAASNVPPTAPGSLTAVVSPGSVAFSWSVATDDHTPVAGLNYNLRVGKTPGGCDVVPPMSDPVTGRRRVPQRGPIQLSSSTLSLPPGTYYWSVQAIDSAFLGGSWSAEGSFTVP